MDKVRLGRVLGKATRLAARTAFEAADAAMAPNPAESRARAAQQSTPRVTEAQSQRAPEPRRATVPEMLGRVGPARQSVMAGTQVFRERTMHPLRQASRALWLEVTGSFFALFAFVFLVAAWQFRDGWHGRTGIDGLRLAAVLVLAGVFGWFSVSSFLRARRRG